MNAPQGYLPFVPVKENRRPTVDGFESVGARGFEPPTSYTPFNGKRVHRVI